MVVKSKNKRKPKSSSKKIPLPKFSQNTISQISFPTDKSPIHDNPEMEKDIILQITGLVVNMFILPGLGSIIAGRIKTGIWQLVLFFLVSSVTVISFPLIFDGNPIFLLGCLLLFSIWIWGIITAIQSIRYHNR